MSPLVKSCSIETTALYDIVDITDEVSANVARSTVASGRAFVMVPEPGCCLVANENEAGLRADLQATLKRLASDGSGAVPIGSASITLPIADGSLGLGTWQRLLLVELEKPGLRSVTLHIVGDPDGDTGGGTPIASGRDGARKR